MIEPFLKYNREKAIFAFKIISIIFGIIITLFLIFLYKVNNLPDVFGIVFFYSISILLPFFILFLEYSGWKSERKRLLFFFNKEPYIRLDSLGFESVIINEKSKWKFTSETKTGEVNGYKMFCVIPEKSSDILGFSVPLKFTRRTLSEYKSIEKRLKEKGIEFNNSFATRLFKDDEINISIKLLENELRNFTLTLSKESLYPDKTNSYGLF